MLVREPQDAQNPAREESPQRAVPSLGDYHVHTRFSDGKGDVAEFVERAIALGLPEIGFSDHLVPPGLGDASAYGVPPDQLEAYVTAVRDAAARYPEIHVLLGVEADYLIEYEDALAEMLAQHPFDYVLGSIHFVGSFDFADEAKEHHPLWSDVDEVFRGYYEATCRAAESGLFQIMAHVGYVGLWGHQPSDAIVASEGKALRAIAEAGMVLELNTGGPLDPIGDMYPSRGVLQRAARMGIPLTLSSDAHSINDVAMLYAEGVIRARAAGYNTVVRMSDHAEVPLP